MATAFASLSDALDYLGLECIVLSTGEHGLLNSIQGDGRLECPFGFFRELSDVAPVPALSSISLALSPTSVVIGDTSAATVTAHYADGSTASVAGTLTSGTPAVASVDGLELTGLTAGTSSITAAFGGKTSSGVTLTVTAS